MKKINVIIAAALMAMVFMVKPAKAQTLFGEGTSYSISNVVLPDLPESLDFAGEPVPLQNYDTRESMEREMLVTLYMHSRTYQTLLNTKRYFPVIEPILKKHGIPDDFKYLCVAESGLNPNAVSSASAAGLWQFVSSAGKQYGLFIDKGLDERYDVEKSTEAACKYIKDAYNRFGSWTMAAAAYNVGNAGVSRRIGIQGVDDYYDAFFPEETMRYVFRILSFKLLIEDPYRYGYIIKPEQYYKPFRNFKEVSVSGAKIDWSKVARDNGTTYKMLRQLNPWVRDYEYNNAGNRTFKLRIPNEGFRADAGN